MEVPPDQHNRLAGRVVGVTAERRAEHQRSYLAARGADVRLAPVLRTTNARERPELLTVTDQLIGQPPDLLVVQTGQGLSWWLEGARATGRGGDLETALTSTEVLARGSKAASTAKRLGLNVSWQAPNEDVTDVAEFLLNRNLSGLRVALLLDGNDDNRLPSAVAKAGGDLLPLDVYRYDLPLDLEPATGLINEVLSGSVDAVTFTASPAIRHLCQIAEQAGLAGDLANAFQTDCVAVLVGPVCSTTATAVGWTKTVEPKMARLIPMLDALVEHFSPST